MSIRVDLITPISQRRLYVAVDHHSDSLTLLDPPNLGEILDMAQKPAAPADESYGIVEKQNIGPILPIVDLRAGIRSS